MSPQRIQQRRSKGWRLPENAVIVSRPSRYGNPFIVGRDGTRAECVRLYLALAAGLECVTSGATHAEQMNAREAMEAAKTELAGKDLACWCPLDGQPCHADVLLDIANQPEVTS